MTGCQDPMALLESGPLHGSTGGAGIGRSLLGTLAGGTSGATCGMAGPSTVTGDGCVAGGSTGALLIGWGMPMLAGTAVVGAALFVVVAAGGTSDGASTAADIPVGAITVPAKTPGPAAARPLIVP